MAAPQRTDVQGQVMPQISVCFGLFHSNVISLVIATGKFCYYFFISFTLQNCYLCKSFLEILKTDIINWITIMVKKKLQSQSCQQLHLEGKMKIILSPPFINWWWLMLYIHWLFLYLNGVWNVNIYYIWWHDTAAATATALQADRSGLWIPVGARDFLVL